MGLVWRAESVILLANPRLRDAVVQFRWSLLWARMGLIWRAESVILSANPGLRDAVVQFR